MSTQSEITQKLQDSLQPQWLEVLNESHMHSVPPNAETHFKVTVVSVVFNDKRKVARHQMVYQLLQQALDGPVHALALHTYTPEEWRARENQSPASPECASKR